MDYIRDLSRRPPVSLRQIHDALKAGHVDGPAFMKMRDEVKRALVGGTAPKEGLKATVSEMLSGGLICPVEADRLTAALRQGGHGTLGEQPKDAIRRMRPRPSSSEACAGASRSRVGRG